MINKNEWFKNKKNSNNFNYQKGIVIGLAVLTIIAVGIKTYQNEKAKEEFLNNTVTKEKVQKYENPKVQSLYDELDNYLKNSGIQIFNLEVKEDENGTIGYYFQYDLINENRINEITPQLKEILKKYQNHQTIYQKQTILKPESIEHPYQKIINDSNTKKYYTSDTKQEEKKEIIQEYQGKKTKSYTVHQINDKNYVLTVNWEQKYLQILLDNYDYENIKQSVLTKRNIIINNCYDTKYYNYTKYDMCYFNFVD